MNDSSTAGAVPNLPDQPSPDATMVERVARAIFRSQYVNPQSVWEGMTPFAQDGYRSDARAAIAAMREPTEHMIDTAMAIDACDLKSEYIAMIDAALSQETKSYG